MSEVIHINLPPEHNNIKSVILDGIEYINDCYTYPENSVICVPISDVLNQSRFSY